MYSSEMQIQLYEKLHRDLGDVITTLLDDPDVNEIMVNPDGKLWIGSNQKGMCYFDDLSYQQTVSVIQGVASIHNQAISQHAPSLEVDLPLFRSMKGERFTAQVPPIVAAPSFTIHKRTEQVVYSLQEYLDAGRISLHQSEVLVDLIQRRQNILVCGDPASGKTTLMNALILTAIQCDPTQRFLILENLSELQCPAVNKVSLLATENMTLRDLLRLSLRMRPDRILVGEIQGNEALDLLKAWSTRRWGGIATLYAQGAEEALQKVIDFTLEAGLMAPPISLFKQAVQAIVSVEPIGHHKGFVRDISTIEEDLHGHFTFKKLD